MDIKLITPMVNKPNLLTIQVSFLQMKHLNIELEGKLQRDIKIQPWQLHDVIYLDILTLSLPDRPTNQPTNRQTDLRGHREVTLLIFDFRYYNSEKAFPDKWNSCELSPRNDKGENRPKSQTSQTLL